MTRTIATANRPGPHVFDADPMVPPDWKGTQYCRAVVPSAQGSGLLRCALAEGDSVHVTESELAKATGDMTAAGDMTSRILGERRDRR